MTDESRKRGPRAARHFAAHPTVFSRSADALIATTRIAAMTSVRPSVFRAAAIVLGLIVAVLSAIVALEAYVRVSWDPKRGTPGFFISDPVRLEKLAPDYTGWFAGVPVHINHLGFRDPREYALEKAPGTFRIVVLGDSVTFGHGSIEEHTYPRLLETLLKERRPDVQWQVWNLGVPGYNTAQELAYLLEAGPAFQPDLVVVGFYDNDVMANRPLRIPSRRTRVASDLLNTVRRHLYSFEWYRRVYAQWAAQSPPSAAAEELLADIGRVTNLEEQQLRTLTPIAPREFDRSRCATENVADITPSPTDDLEHVNSVLVAAASADPKLQNWKAAVRGFQDLHRRSSYRIVFFVNMAPSLCQTDDYFKPRNSRTWNDYFLRVLGDSTPVVSSHDAFLRYHPSAVPLAGGHSLGNSNLVKAQALASFLEEHDLVPPRISR